MKCLALICLGLAAFPAGARDRRDIANPYMLSGIYIVSQPNQGISSTPRVLDALGRSFVSGIFVRTTWREVEPNKDNYDWSYLDSQIAQAGRMGKKVLIGVAAGIFTPDWVLNESKTVSTVTQLRRLDNFCTSVRVPVPWDSRYLASWTSFVQAMGARYSENQSVTAVKYGGINFQTWEAMLPHHDAYAPNLPLRAASCRIPDDVRVWRDIGYSTELIETAFKRILLAYDIAFPDKPIVLMTGANGFPPIGDGGRPDPEAAEIGTRQFYAIGRQVLGSRFVGQDNALSAVYAAPPVCALAHTNLTGFQTAWPVSGDQSCLMAGGGRGCSEVDAFRRAMTNAIEAGACYVELFPKDVLNSSLVKIINETDRQLDARCQAR
jgi:hypothetical protein